MNEMNNNPIKNEMKSIYIIFGIILAVILVGLGISFVTKKIKENNKEKEENKKEEITNKVEVNKENVETSIEVPDVSELTILEATKELKDLGFEVSSEYDEEYNEDIEKGLVIGTNPKVGSKTKKGKEITLIISLGIEPIIVEDYSGKDIIETKTILETKGLIVTVETKSLEGDYVENTIIEQSVKAGEKLYKGDSITLYIPFIEAVYPNFVGEIFIENDIEEFCANYNITCEYNYNASDTYEKGIITNQNIEPGGVIKENDVLEIIISAGKMEE